MTEFEYEKRKANSESGSLSKVFACSGGCLLEPIKYCFDITVGQSSISLSFADGRKRALTCNGREEIVKLIWLQFPVMFSNLALVSCCSVISRKKTLHQLTIEAHVTWNVSMPWSGCLD